MANLQRLQEFAKEHNFGLTAPLVHNQVVSLAKQWLPQIFFFEQEKFHPISLGEMNSMVKNLFDHLPNNAQNAWRVNLFVRTGENSGADRAFDPPVVHVPDGSIFQPGGNPNAPTTIRSVLRVLNDGISIEEALEHPDADADAVITHGASFRRANQFFGAQKTVSGGEVAVAGDPFRPRAEAGGKPVMTVYASFKNLLDTLEYELAIEEQNELATEEAEKYPPDALRGGFDIAHLLFNRSLANPSPFTPKQRRDILMALIAAEKSNESIEPILKGLPSGWKLNSGAWGALTRYAFLEYEFFYAYNDFERVQDSFFDNEHEGDNEGCCLVFDRRLINLAAAEDDPKDPKLLLLVVPDSIITSVHEEWQHADDMKLIPFFISPPNDPQKLKELVNLAVYVAWGSHATYLTPGEHPLADFQDITSFISDNIPLPLILAFPDSILALLIIALIIEHFDDPKDVTSKDGIRSVPEGTIDEDPAEVSTRLTVMPMTVEDHIYKSDKPEYEELLRLRSFAGTWGGHDDFKNHSPKFETKTGRYFRKLLASL
jgi:hypothetical protein